MVPTIGWGIAFAVLTAVAFGGTAIGADIRAGAPGAGVAVAGVLILVRRPPKLAVHDVVAVGVADAGPEFTDVATRFTAHTGTGIVVVIDLQISVFV